MRTPELTPEWVLVYQHSTSAWGLPCSDADSLEGFLLLRMSGIAFHPISTAYHYSSALSTRRHSLPCLLLPDTSTASQSTMISALKHQYSDVFVDSKLMPEEAALGSAFTSLARTSIRDAVRWSLWCDSTNYRAVTNPLISRDVAFPISAFLLQSKRKLLLSELKEFDIESIKPVLHDLNAILTTKPYILGTRVSSSDAAIAGQLILAYMAPMPKNYVKEYIDDLPKLKSYISVIARSFLQVDIANPVLSVAEGANLRAAEELFRKHDQAKDLELTQPELSDEELAERKSYAIIGNRNRMFVATSGIAFFIYVVFTHT